MPLLRVQFTSFPKPEYLTHPKTVFMLCRLESRWRAGQGMCTRLRALTTPSPTSGFMPLPAQLHRLLGTDHVRMSMTGQSTRQVS